jgi:hypothetical protein
VVIFICLVPNLRGNALCFSPLVILAIVLSCLPLIVLRYIPSIPNFLGFYYVVMLNVIESAFSVDIEIIYFLFYILLMWCIAYYNVCIELCLHPWNKSNMICWCVVEFGLPVFSWEFFHLLFIRDIGIWFVPLNLVPGLLWPCRMSLVELFLNFKKNGNYFFYNIL